MNADTQNPAKNYDYKMFNDEVLSGWHKWMYDIVKEIAPDIPLHSKIIGYTSSHRSNIHSNGTGLQGYYDFFELNGCDYFWNYIDDDTEPLTKELWYDYMMSYRDAPVINSEDHIIPDRGKYYELDLADYVSQDIYQGAIHGRAFSGIWIWERKSVSVGDAEDSILYRPDAISKVGKASMDLYRLSEEISALLNEDPEIGIIYSDPDILNNISGMHAAYEAYEALLFNGKVVRFIPEVKIDTIDSYKVVIVPEVKYITEKMLNGLKGYIENGGRVVIMGENCLRMDEHTFEHDKSVVDFIYSNSTVLPYEGSFDKMLTMSKTEFCSKIREVLIEEGIYYISVVDAETGEPAHYIEYNVGVHDGKVIVNLANFSEPAKVKLYAGGVPMLSATERRSEEKTSDIIEIGKYECLTLETDFDNVFFDTYGHWAADEITKLSNEGVINGRTSSRFDPEGNITRWEFHALLSRAADMTLPKYDSESEAFRPSEYITRKEMCEMLVDFYEAENGAMSVGEKLTFTDVQEDEFISKATGAGLMKGREDGTFDAFGNATRAEAAAVVNRYMRSKYEK